MKKVILIKYGELTTKKSNRNKFIQKLANNIKNKLNDCEYKLEYTIDRMYIYTNEDEKVINELKNVFGIYSICMCYKINSDIDVIKKESLNILKDIKLKTFKVKTKRNDKTFLYESVETSKIIGEYILNNTKLMVDIKNPELILNIEIRKEFTYLYVESINGLGGYPVNMQDKAILMLSGGIDSPVAGYMALKRGIDLDCIYFESPPHTSMEALNKVKELVHILTKYKDNIKLHIVPFTEIQEEIHKKIPKEYAVTILRRMMYLITEQVALNNNAIAIVNGECIGQVASQTLKSINCINAVTNMPIIRPLVCFDKEEIIKIAKEIKTYETSILPYEDCCTIFVAKHPIINPKLEECLKYENMIDYKTMIDKAISNIHTVKISSKDKQLYNDLL